MLILNEVNELCRVCLTYEFKRLDLKRCGKSSDDIHRLFASERFLEKFSRVIDTALCDILLGKTYSVEFFEYRFLDIGTDGSCVGYLKGKLFDLLFLEVLEYTGTSLRTQSDKKYCGFLKTAYFIL